MMPGLIGKHPRDKLSDRIDLKSEGEEVCELGNFAAIIGCSGAYHVIARLAWGESRVYYLGEMG
jgi:hypothetical protein